MGYCFRFLMVAYALLDFLTLGNGIREVSIESSNFNVIDYGAIGDGKNDDSQAFLKAWGDLCNAKEDNPALTVPAGKTFLVAPLSFHGPCKSKSIHVEIQGTIVAPDSRDAWRNCEGNAWLTFSYIDNLIVDGSGQLNGKGSIWWHEGVTLNDAQNDQLCDGPKALAFANCIGLRLGGLTITDSPHSHISIMGCNDSIVSNLHITAPQDSPNTDGIDISYLTNLQFHDSVIGTGDDCVAIGTGSSWINISGITCGPGHGISIGSLGKDGAYAKVEEVHVRNCTFNRTSNGARIKTWQGGSGYARHITFEDIPLMAVDNPIIIDQYYCDGTGCPTEKSAVEISDVRYSGFIGTSATTAAISLNCSATVACTNISMEFINITASSPTQKTSAVCINAQGTANSVTPEVPCLKN